LISNDFGNSVSGPEKAGVGGSIPSLATNPFNTARNPSWLQHDPD
jgi:hypothetical protein